MEAFEGDGGGVLRFGVQPQGTLRDEETCVPAWNNKIRQVFFIKLSGEGMGLLNFCCFSAVSDEWRGSTLAAAPGGGATLGADENLNDKPNETFFDAVCQI